MVNMTLFNITEKCGFGAFFQSLMAQGTNLSRKWQRTDQFSARCLLLLLSGNRNASEEKTTAKLKYK
jgi:hypothetical protein